MESIPTGAIRFDNWTIQADGEIIARQFDNLTRTLTVSGDIPAGWEWAMLVQVNNSMDIISLTAAEGVLSVTLTAQQLSIAGYYQMQLRGTKGDLVRHTNVVTVYIPESLSGDARWPVAPSEFSDMERRLIQTVREAQNAAAEAENAAIRAEEIAEAVKTAGEAEVAAKNAAIATEQSAADASGYRARAEQRANLAESYALNPPIIGENGNWLYWDGAQYVDSGKSSESELTKEQANNIYANILKDPASGEPLDINETFKKLEQAIISMGGKI